MPAGGLNVLLLAQFYPPVIGGEERHVQALASGLSARGHTVSVATLRTAAADGSGVEDGIRVDRLPGTTQRLGGLYQTNRRLAPPLPDPETTLALRELVFELRPDVVHAHNWMLYSYLPLAQPGRRPLVLSLHDYGQVCAKKTLILRDDLCRGPGLGKCLGCAARHYGSAKGVVTVAGSWAMAAAARRLVDVFLPVSTAVAEGNRLVPDGLRHEVVPNFIADDPPEPDADAVGGALPDDGFILYVGALARRKGIEVLLEAYRRLRRPPPLVLVGYRSSDVIPGLDRLPPGVAVFTDWPPTSVAYAWRRSLFGVVPSTWADPCPTVVIEAMASGRAVVGSRIGGIEDLVRDEHTGLLVRAGDATALAQAMQRLLDDPRRAAEMGAAGLVRSGNYRASAVVSRIDGIYSRLLEERAAARAGR